MSSVKYSSRIIALALFVSLVFVSANLAQKIFLKKVVSFGVHKNDWIADAFSIAPLPDGSIIVSDKLNYSLKKFDRNGNLIGTAGKRGDGPGEFRAPGEIYYRDGKIVVADFAYPRVQVFSSDLKYITTFYTKGPVFSLAIGKDNALWIGAYTADKNQELFKYNLSGKLIKSIPLKNTTGDPFGDISFIAVMPDGRLLVCYLIKNKIEMLDQNGKFLKEFSVPGIVDKPTFKKLSEGPFSTGNMTVPEGNIFQNCGCDNLGNIYILAGDYTDNLLRDVYVLNSDGKLIRKFSLPVKSPRIFIQDKFLYTIEEEHTIVRKYLISNQ